MSEIRLSTICEVDNLAAIHTGLFPRLPVLQFGAAFSSPAFFDHAFLTISRCPCRRPVVGSAQRSAWHHNRIDIIDWMIVAFWSKTDRLHWCGHVWGQRWFRWESFCSVSWEDVLASNLVTACRCLGIRPYLVRICYGWYNDASVAHPGCRGKCSGSRKRCSGPPPRLHTEMLARIHL